MKKAEQLGIVGILLSMSVGFWGKDMADYVETKLILPSADSFISTNNTKYVNLGDWAKTNSNWSTDLKTWSEEVRLQVTNSASNARGLLPWLESYRTNEQLKVTFDPKTMRGQRERARAEFHQAASLNLWERLVSWLGVLFAGCVFMIDVACIYWWYFRYIYKIQTTPTLRSMFFDIAVCASFNLAAARWTNSLVFLMASGAGSSLLIARFVDLYRSPEASFSDRTILKRAGGRLAFWFCH